MICEADARDLGVGEGSPVTVSSSVGEMSAVVAVVDISRGSAAMYYPEANAIVPRILDPKSHTPAFKSVAVRILPAA